MLKNRSLHDAIASLSLFSALQAEARQKIEDASILQYASRGLILFEQGARPTFQAIVLEGTVHLLGQAASGQEMVIETVEPPGFLLPAAILQRAPYLMRAQCVEDVCVLMIKADIFREVATTEMALALGVIDVLADQFRAMVRQIKTLKLRSGPQRVAAYILTLSLRQGKKNDLILPYEKGVIASQLGMTRESFSRILSFLQREIIDVSGQKIHIRDRLALEAINTFEALIDGTDS